MEASSLNFAEWLALEAKQEREIYYHGTGSQLLPVILSQGLIPNPKKRAWDKDPDAGFDRASRASLEGVYVTTNLMTAKASAFRVAKGNGEKPFNELVVVMDIHPYSLVGDEDDFMGMSSISVPGLLTTEYSITGVYFPWKILTTPSLLKQKMAMPHSDHWVEDSRNYVEKAREAYVNDSLRRISYKVKEEAMHPELLKRLKALIAKDGFEMAMTRQVAYIEPRSYNRACRDHWDSQECPAGMEQPDKKEAEKKWQEFLDQITRTVKKTAQPSARKSDFNNTARLVKPIGFTGKDKIVCIIEVLPYTKELERNYTPVVVRYGKVPQKLIDDWEKAQGRWVVQQRAA